MSFLRSVHPSRFSTHHLNTFSAKPQRHIHTTYRKVFEITLPCKTDEIFILKVKLKVHCYQDPMPKKLFADILGPGRIVDLEDSKESEKIFIELADAKALCISKPSLGDSVPVAEDLEDLFPQPQRIVS